MYIANERNAAISNHIQSLESTWKEIREEKDMEEPRVQDIPRAKIFLATIGAGNTSKNSNTKTISISTKASTEDNHLILQSRGQRPSLKNHRSGKWQKEDREQPTKNAKTESQSQELFGNKCGSPIKRFLNRFREITKEIEDKADEERSKVASAPMEIEDILFMNARRA